MLEQSGHQQAYCTALSATQQMASYGVGAIYASSNTSLSFSGTSNFSHNSAAVGGAVGTVDNVTLAFNGTVFFNNSVSDSGGAIFAVGNTLLSFNGANEFTHNSAQSLQQPTYH